MSLRLTFACGPIAAGERLSGRSTKMRAADDVAVEREAAYALESRLSATQIRTGGVFGSQFARAREK